ncbi:MAG: glucose-6-phosphate dehydrogenase assembly protein OpcA [Treponemataceae bacterium]
MNYPKNSELEKDLVARLRETASGNARAMTASVVVAGSAANAEAGDFLVDKLMGRRPARIIHLRTGSNVADGFRAWSSARCSMDRQNRGVCFEDVFIESSNEAAADSRSWSPFVMRELPALLLWRFPVAALCEESADCGERVDLVVIDGGDDPFLARDGAVGYARMVLGAIAQVPALADLAWERGESVRTATARLFEAPGDVASASAIVSVQSSGPDPWSVCLHAAWMAAALGWKGESSSVDGSGPWLRKDGGTVAVTVGAGQFPSCSVGFSDGSSASVVFRNDREAVLTLAAADGKSTVAALDMLFPAPDDGMSLARLIDTPVADPLYAKALTALVGV